MIAAMCAVATIIGAIWWLHHFRRNRYRRFALRELHVLHSEWQIDSGNLDFAQAVNRLLKQCALAAFPRRDIAALNGAEWLDFLDRHLRKPRFTDPDVRALANLYQSTPPAIAPDTLRDAAEYWIRRHRC